MKTRKQICLILIPLIIISDIFYFYLLSDILKLAFILSLLFTAYFKKDWLLFAALVFGSAADIILMFTIKYQLGILFFSIAFCIYIIRHKGRKVLIPLIFAAVFALNRTDMPSIYIIYACLFYVNFYYVFKNCRRLFPAFLLFAICDIFTALRFYNPKLPAFAIWLFYAPSLYLLIFTPATM